MLKKKILPVILIAVLLTVCLFNGMPVYAASIWNGSVASAFAGGSGTEENPYLIADGSQLAAMKSNAFYKLTADIYLNDTSNWSKWETAAPANTWEAKSFSELSLDGSGFTIYGLYTKPGTDNAALIDSLNGGYVKNLTVDKSLIQGADYCGGFVGGLNNGTIDNCVFSGKLLVAGYGNGGICGDVRGESSIISNCVNKGTCINTLKDEDNAYRFAGIVGQACDGALISNCKNEGTVQSFAIQSGGIVGHAYTDVVIEKCENTGDVIAAGDVDYMTNIGGIAGGMYDNVTLTDCVNSGNISSLSRVAGIAGSVGTDCSVISSVNYGQITATSYQNGGIAGGIFEGALIDRCINYGSVTVDADEYCCGGIAGFANTSSVKNCINFGDVTAKRSYRVGGILGNGYGIGEEVANCYNTGRVEGKSDVGGIIGSVWESYMIRNVLQAGEVYGDRAGLIVGRDDSTIETAIGWYQDDLQTLKDLQNTIGTFVPVSEAEIKSQAFIDEINTWITENQTKLTNFYLWSLGDSSTFGYPKLTNEKPPVVRKADEYRIESLTVTDLNGKKLSSVPIGRSLVTLSITKQLDIDDTVVLLGTYTKDGQFEGVLWVKIEDLSQTGRLKITLPLNNPAGKIVSLKAYTIGGFDEPVPLGGTVTFPK